MPTNLNSARARRPAKSQALFAASLIALSILVPGLLFGWIAWQERVRAMDEGQAAAQRTVGALHEHALRALETGELLIRHVDRMVIGREWRDIERDARLHEELAALMKAAPGLTAVLMADATGRVRGGSGQFPVYLSLAGSEYFRALKDGRKELFVGATSIDRVSAERIVPLAIPRSGRGEGFDGVIMIGLPLDYFTGFWERFAPTSAHVIPMMREDGELLVRHPAAKNPRRLEPEAPFMQHIRRAPSGVYTAVSRVDGVERLNAYTRIGHYPLYLSFSVETQAILAGWRRGLVSRAWFTLLAMVALLALSGVLIRHTRREREAAERWRESAQRLEAEMARREAAEDTLRQAQKMETIGQITGGVAHDFNNLLQVLSNNLHLAARTAHEPTRAAAFIGAGLQAVERGAKLTRHLLAFSRRQPLAPEAVDVEAMLNEMTGLLRTTLGATVEVKLSPGAKLWHAMIDRNQAEMAILNLAVNARDAMPGGGTVTISTANVHLAQEEAAAQRGLRCGEYVVIAVGDTGTGMTSEVAKRAFEPFFTTKEVGKGSGLGLSQVHGFAAQSGGTVHIETRPGAGTTVKLYLPRALRAEDAPPILPPSAPSVPAGEKILLVDDDAPVRNGIAAGLAGLGYTVIEAGSGAAALEALRATPDIRVLVTDYMMPGMRGTELARSAKAISASLEVLLISGFADLPEGEALRWNLLRKPFTPDALATRIAELRQARGRAPSGPCRNGPASRTVPA